jgi:hypothetical protein
MAGNNGRSEREAGIKYTRARYNSDGNFDTGNKSAIMGFAWILYHSYAYWDIGGLTDSIRNANVCCKHNHECLPIRGGGDDDVD